MTHLHARLWLFAALACLPVPQACAQPNGTLVGMWVWDKAHLVPAPNMPALTHMLYQRWLVTRDDGMHYSAQRQEVYDDAAGTILENVPEDGAAHAVRGGTLRLSVLPNGARRFVFTARGETYDRQCSLSADGNTMTCNGIHHASDGSSGDYISIYRRDQHGVTVPPNPSARGQ